MKNARGLSGYGVRSPKNSRRDGYAHTVGDPCADAATTALFRYTGTSEPTSLIVPLKTCRSSTYSKIFTSRRSPT